MSAPRVTAPTTSSAPARRLRGSEPFSHDPADRERLLKWFLIGLTCASALALIVALDLRVHSASLMWPAAFVALLIGFGRYYRRRGLDRFALCVRALLHLTVFSSCYTLVMYATAAIGRPLVDAELMRLDQLLGVHLPSIVDWAARHPNLQGWLQFSYNTLLPQTAAVIAILGFSGARRPLEEFIQRFMVSALLTLALFAVLPAVGPFESYGYPCDDAQQRYLQHFEALRSAEMRTVSLAQAEGLITFPSFHSTWALLLASALLRRRRLFPIAVVLNGAVLVSTLTSGWHYACDVLAGAAVFVIAVAVSHRLRPRLYPADPLC